VYLFNLPADADDPGMKTNRLQPSLLCRPAAGSFAGWRRWWSGGLDRIRRAWLPARRGAESARRAVVLRRNEVLRLEPDRHRCVILKRGIVWLTGNPADRDVVLHSGGQYHCADRWPVVLEALEEAEIVLLG